MNDVGSSERLWVSLLDSRFFRRLARRGLGLKLMRGHVFQQARLLKDRLSTADAVRKQPDLFREVQTFCLFIGHNKSGTSMLGALLDAHPEVILADEVGALNYLLAGFRREQVFHLLLRGSRRERLKGRVTARRLTPYSYAVPGQWQGNYNRLRVIGDGKAGTTTQLLASQPDALSRTQAAMNGMNLRFIQTIRNPFDPISVMMVRGQRSFENSIAHYFSACDNLVRLREQIGPQNLLSVRYEEFVRHPELSLMRLAAFIGVETSPEYLSACAGILRPEPDVQRHMVSWQPDWIQLVEANIKKYDFLQGYDFRAR